MGPYETRLISVATERERQLTTARANQTTGLTNGTAANWASEVEFSPYRALSRRQMTFPFVDKSAYYHRDGNGMSKN